MKLWDVAGIVLTLCALFGYLNRRYLRLPGNIGFMLVALVVSLGLIVAALAGAGLTDNARKVIQSIDFSTILLHGALGFLLFAGGLRLDLKDLLAEKWAVLTLALASTFLSTVLVGGLTYALSALLGLSIPILTCFVFGALISPTDPVAVLATLRNVGVPKALSSQLAGESLFNDGIGIVLFLVLLGLAAGTGPASPGAAALLFVVEFFGGLAFGLVAGYAAHWMLQRVDDGIVEILITLSLVTGGYALADHLHVSAPIAMVVAGLLVGSRGNHFGLSEDTRETLETFWEVIEGVLNAVLFVLIGLEILAMTFREAYFIAIAVTVPAVLLSRFLSVALPASVIRFFRELPPRTIRFLTWGGLRGGLAIAMTLSLPSGDVRSTLLAMTYGVVVFSILIQGSTMAYFARKSFGPAAEPVSAPQPPADVAVKPEAAKSE